MCWSLNCLHPGTSRELLGNWQQRDVSYKPLQVCLTPTFIKYSVRNATSCLTILRYSGLIRCWLVQSALISTFARMTSRCFGVCLSLAQKSLDLGPVDMMQGWRRLLPQFTAAHLSLRIWPLIYYLYQMPASQMSYNWRYAASLPLLHHSSVNIHLSLSHCKHHTLNFNSEISHKFSYEQQSTVYPFKIIWE